MHDSDAVVITVTGINFGTTDYNATVQIGATQCTSTWTSDTSLSCTLAPGVGVNLDFNVSVYAGTENEMTGESALPWDYQRPVITSVELNRQTGALPRVAIYGHGFGTADNSPVAIVGDSACTETKWITDRYLTCLVPPGSGVVEPFQVTVAGALSLIDADLTFTYLATPRVDGVSNMVWSNVTSADVARVTVTGARFGTSNTVPRVLVGDTVALETSWISDSSVSAQIAPGVGKELPIGVKVYAQTGVSNSSFFCYQAPVVTLVVHDTGLPAGNFSVTVLGSNFGDHDYNQIVMIDGDHCLESKWISSTAMHCTAPAGYGLVDVAVDAGGNVGSQSEMFQFAGASGRGICPLPDVDCSAETQPRRTAGGDVLRVFGEQFGPNRTYESGSFKVIVGETACQQTTWVSQSAVDCVLAPGTGKDLDVTIVILDYLSRMGGIFTYDQPVVTGLTPSHLPTRANITISVHGINFGTSCASASGQVPSLCLLSVTVGATECDKVNWISDTTVACRVAMGTGLELPVKVDVDDVEGSLLNATSFSYDAPIISAVTPASVPDYGGINVTVSGRNFGFEPPSSPGIFVRVGNSACSPVVWRSDSEVICRVASAMSNMQIFHSEDVAASVKGNFRPVGDPPVLVSYFAAPIISSFVPRKISVVGGKTLTIHGNWFTPRTNEPAPFVTVGGRPCPLLNVPRSINLLTCTSPALDEGPWTVEVNVGNRMASKVLESAPPLVTSVTAITPAMNGGAPMTIYGSNFGVAEPTVLEAIVNRQKCSPLDWVSETSIECTLPKGVPSTAPSVVVRRANLEGVPFYFTPTDPEAPKPRTAMGLVSKGSAIQLVSVDVVDGSVKTLSSFRLGAVDYGMAGYDPESNEFKVVSVLGQPQSPASHNYVSIHPEQGASDSSFELDLRQYRAGGSIAVGGAGRLLLQEHLFSFGGSKDVVETANTVLTNVEYDQQRQNLVGTLVTKGRDESRIRTPVCPTTCQDQDTGDDVCQQSCVVRSGLDPQELSECLLKCAGDTVVLAEECVSTEQVIFDTVNGSTYLRPIANAQVAFNVRALDTKASNFFVILEGVDQRLLIVTTDPHRLPSACESVGGVCQAVSGGTQECVHIAAEDSEAKVNEADAICAALGAHCHYAEWVQSLGMYVMRIRGGASMSCPEPRVLYGPVMHGVRAMTFDVQRERLLLIIEDVNGVHRSSPDDNFVLAEMDIRSIAPLPKLSIYNRVYNRRLLAMYTFWERDTFWPSEGISDTSALQVAMPATKVVTGFGARRVIPGFMVLLYSRGLALVQEEPDAIRAFKYLPGDAPVASDSTDQTEVSMLLSEHFRDMRAMFPAEDLKMLSRPSIVYVSPSLVSAQGTTEITILGSNFGVLDSSPIIRVNGRECGTSKWISSVELLCTNVPAMPSGSLLDLVGGRVSFGRNDSVAHFPEALKYVSSEVASEACCRTCKCPYEIWTTESSGHHELRLLLSQVVSDPALQLCGPNPRSCSLKFVDGNSDLLVDGSLMMDGNGSLHFDLAAFQNGYAMYELSVTDGYVEARQNISIVTRAVNNAPTVTLNDNGVLVVCEDGAAGNGRLSQISFAQVSPGASTADELAQKVTVQVTPDSGNFSNLFQTSSSMPMIYPGSGVLSFKLVPDQFGTASFNVSVRDNGGRGTQIPGTPPPCDTPSHAGMPVTCNWDEGPIVPLTIHVTRQNTAPHFNFGTLVNSTVPASVTVDGHGLLQVWEGEVELMLDGFATDIVAGSRAEEAGQSVSFSVTRVSSNIDILMRDPVLHANGTLTLTPGENINGRGGVEMFLVTLTDDSPVACGGSNSFARNLTVEVDYVNHQPSFSLATDLAITVQENECSAQACSVPSIVSEYSAGPNEAWQSTSFVVHIPLVTRSDCGGSNLFDPTAFSASGKSNPHIDASGALVFSVVPWCSGVALVEMEVVDSGGTARGGVNRSHVQAVNITVVSVDQPPSFILGSNQVFVDSGNYELQVRASFASDMSPGAPGGRDVDQILAFTLVVVQKTALPGVNGGQLFAEEPSIDVSSGDLTLRIAQGQFGSATVNVTLQDSGLLSYAEQITITCRSINDPPIMTFASRTFTVNENSGANGPVLIFSHVSSGFSDEAQEITFNVSQIGGAVGLFTATPSVYCTQASASTCSSADLTFELAGFRWGNATFEVVAIDDGPSGDGNQNTAAPVSFTIVVRPANDVPSFELPSAELEVNQNSWCVEGPALDASGNCSYTAEIYVQDMDKWHLRRNFASSILMGGSADRSEIRAAASYVHSQLNLPLTVAEGLCPSEPCLPQKATFAVVAHDIAASQHLFVSPPSVALDGSLIFALRDNTHGVATFSITLTDDGGAVTAGLTSASQTFTIKVLPVNTAPTYEISVPEIVVQPYAMAQETRNFLRNISVGPADEVDQTFEVLLHVKPSDRSLFAAAGLPRYRAYENSLVFIPAATVPASSVSIEVQVEVQDTGGNLRSRVPSWTPIPVGSDNSTVVPITFTFVGAAPSGGGGDTWSKLTSAHLPSLVAGVALSPRLGHAVVEFMGDIWVLGGYTTPKDNASAPWRVANRRLLTEDSSQYLLSDVWRLRHVKTGICRQQGLCLEQARVQQHAWPARHSHAALVFDNRIWVMGGVTALAVPAHDVWSSYDGVHWQLVTASAAWAPRFGMAVDTMANPGGLDDPGIMIVSGGGSYTGAGEVMYNDVWTSIDGQDWRLASADAGWTPRARHAMASLRGPEGNATLWLAGGEEVGGGTRRDVWYSDDAGATWQLDSGSAPWLDRAGHAMVRYRGQLFLTAGRTSAFMNVDLAQPILRDVWKSADGRVWEQVLDEAPFDGREDFGMAVHAASDRLVIVGGQGQIARMADVWVSPQN
jgi:hypothetical protein